RVGRRHGPDGGLDRPVPAPGGPVGGGGRAAHELPPAPVDAAGASRPGHGRALARAVPGRPGRWLPLPLVRRRHAGAPGGRGRPEGPPVTRAAAGALGPSLTPLEVTATDGTARAGVLRTPRGAVTTPAFMPVGTRGAVRTLSS